MKPRFVYLCSLLLLLVCDCHAADAGELLGPREYSSLHILAQSPKDPKWVESIQRLAKGGDGFTLERLRALEVAKLSASQRALVATAISAINKRVAEEDLQTFTKLIQLRLERAAWADLTCNPLEGRLVLWTRSFIEKQADKPEVAARLRQIESNYNSSVDVTTLFSTMRERVPLYARRILAATSKSSDATSK